MAPAGCRSYHVNFVWKVGVVGVVRKTILCRLSVEFDCCCGRRKLSNDKNYNISTITVILAAKITWKSYGDGVRMDAGCFILQQGSLYFQLQCPTRAWNHLQIVFGAWGPSCDIEGKRELVLWPHPRQWSSQRVVSQSFCQTTKSRSWWWASCGRN